MFLKVTFLRNAKLDVELHFLPSVTFLSECFLHGIILKSTKNDFKIFKDISKILNLLLL